MESVEVDRTNIGVEVRFDAATVLYVYYIYYYVF